MGDYKDINEIPRYEQIAVDLATKVAQKVYVKGTKLYGRSTLAGQYNVSPETIRRAVALIQTMGIVEVVTGKGIIVRDSIAAQRYIESFKQRRALTEAQEEFSQLLDDRRKVDLAIEKQIKKIMNFSSRLVNILPKVEEVVLSADSPLVGKSLIETAFRSKTGATVLAIEREGIENFSPDITMQLREGDILVYIGDEESLEKVEEFANS